MNNFTFDYIDKNIIDYFNIQPSQVKGRANITTEYYRRILYNLLYSVYDFKLPKNWKKNFFRFWLFGYGSISVIYTDEFGWICNPYSIKELDLYYNPRVIEVWNRFLKDRQVGVIGVNAGIIHCFDDFFGFDDIISHFAVKFASIDKSFDINLMNTNFALLAETDSKKRAEEIKEAYGNATSGEPLVVINDKVLNGKELKYLFPNSANNFIGNELLQARRGVMNEFLTVIGIRNSNYEKRERLISSEVNENNDETSAIVNIVYENLKEDIEEIRKISDLDISVSLRYDYIEELKGVIDNGKIDVVGNK